MTAVEGDERRYDLVVIGGGVNGAGIARDAAMRGLDVALFEKGDFGSGTSAWSSRLIHGGLRYLEYFELPLVYESLNERRRLQSIAPHLVKPIRIAIPIYEGSRRGPLLIRLGLLLYDLLSFRKSLPNRDLLKPQASLAAEPGLNPDGLRGLARYYDAQVTFAERLVLENVLDARAHGADVHNYSPVVEILIDGDRASGVAWQDRQSGERRECRARTIINAAGPWVDDVLDTAGREGTDYIGGTKGSHIVVAPFDGAPNDALYVEARSDGRPFFVLPWNGQVLIGTTDIRYDGSLDETRISEAETDYLIEETNRVFPRAGLERSDVHYAYAGVRPLPRREEGPESAITRRHAIVENRDVGRGLYSIVGGKLTTYRSLAEEAVDTVAARLDKPLRESRSGETPLPGAFVAPSIEDRTDLSLALPGAAVERLATIYGSRASDIFEGIADGRYPDGVLDPGGRVLKAEIAFAFDRELARDLCDVIHRRLMVGFDPDQGRSLYEAIADVAAGWMGWSADERDAALRALNDYSDSFLVNA